MLVAKREVERNLVVEFLVNADFLKKFRADADPLFNDRLILGMKGIMAESELHVLRARLEGGIKNKAARGELRRGLEGMCEQR